jgi:CheY-like chemotaxis protein
MKAGGNTLVGDRRLLMTRPRSQQRSRIRPRRVLIVEDDLVIALMMEEIVREMGCAVSGIAGTLGMARLQLAKRDFDAVLLDVNLGGEYNPETADLLLEMRVPFAFVTGYDYVVEPRHDNVPLLQKPFSSIQLRVLVEQLVGSVPSGGGAAQTA